MFRKELTDKAEAEQLAEKIAAAGFEVVVIETGDEESELANSYLVASPAEEAEITVALAQS